MTILCKDRREARGRPDDSGARRAKMQKYNVPPSGQPVTVSFQVKTPLFFPFPHSFEPCVCGLVPPRCVKRAASVDRQRGASFQLVRLAS